MRRIKAADIIIILCFVFAIGVSLFMLIRSGRGDDLLVFVKTPSSMFVYSTDANDTYTFRGLIGDTVVEIADGAARVVSSPCPNKTCIQQGSISRPGQWIACLPNGVIVYIEGAGEERSADVSSF